MIETDEEERLPVEMLDPTETVILRGTARVTRDPISREMTDLDDYRSDEGRPLGLPPGNYRWVLKLNTGETDVIETGDDYDEILLRGDVR